ncbi:MAG: hypothetical protein KAI55_03445 [Candidatus Aenigmarchaeota archaeon]|nr:hypothetical protein [Candidatus Aenigmarchaeota archaeon]
MKIKYNSDLNRYANSKILPLDSKSKKKKAQAYLLGGFMLVIVLSLFIVSQTHKNISTEKTYIMENIAGEFKTAINAFFIQNNSIEYIDSGLNNHSLLAENFAKSKAYEFQAYYLVMLPDNNVVFGNYFDQNIDNVTIFINDESLSDSISSKSSRIFYFNVSNSNTIDLNYSFSVNSKNFEKNTTIQNALFYVHWAKLTKEENVFIKEISG